MSEIRVDTIAEKTSANGVAVDGVTLKDGGIAATLASTITTADNTAQLTLKSTDADANSGPLLVLNRDSGSPADNDACGLITFKADDDGGNSTELVNISAKFTDVSNGAEDATFNISSVIGGSHMSRFIATASETVLNDDSGDIDFRVEGNGLANAFFVNGATDRVGINTNAPADQLHVVAVDSSGISAAKLEANSAYGVPLEINNSRADTAAEHSILIKRDGTTVGAIGGTDNDLTIFSSTNVAMQIDGTGAVIKPAQPAFSVHKNGTDQSNMAIADTTVTWTHERFDQNADFNLTNNNFVAPVTGKYFLNFMARLEAVDTGANYYIANIVTSNAAYRYIIDPNFSADLSYFKIQVTVLADMDASDTAHVSFVQNGGTQQTDIDGDATETFFMGHLAC